MALRKNIPGIYNLPRKYRKYQVRSQLLSMPNIGQWPSGSEIVRWTMVRVFACRLILVHSTIPYCNTAGTTLHYMAHLPQMCPWSQISRPLAGNVAVCAVKIFTTFFERYYKHYTSAYNSRVLFGISELQNILFVPLLQKNPVTKQILRMFRRHV